ncbi:hypothetical protein [Streptomyces laurentii]|uniref:hypothetical protein n=1 Tax=Streptomyces laurentii TaxID=39478 RepID=UPI0036ABD989
MPAEYGFGIFGTIRRQRIVHGVIDEYLRVGHDPDSLRCATMGATTPPGGQVADRRAFLVDRK